jgi:hypothetical protein
MLKIKVVFLYTCPVVLPGPKNPRVICKIAQAHLDILKNMADMFMVIWLSLFKGTDIR